MLAIYGNIQYFGLLLHGTNFKIVGNFDNPAGYASMLTLSLPFVLHFTSFNKRCIKYIAWIVFIIICTAVVLSASRVGILVVLVLIILFVLKQNKALLNVVIWKKIVFVFLLSIIISFLYYAKKDSADGRILIWRCTVDMIKEKPLFGHGYKSFEAKYMLYQAHYFEQYPESNFALLADNVKHPFNEFLLLISEFGLIAFLLLVLFFIRLAQIYFKNQNEKSFMLLLVWVAILILSCFSYPFQYPFTWLIVGFSVGSLSALSNQNNKQFQIYWIPKIFVSFLSITLLWFTVREMYYVNKWYNIANQTTFGKTHTIIREYECLYPYMDKNACFIYNYAARLNYVNDIEKSTEILTACEKIFNDYDVQMLKADNYKKQHDFYKAKDCYTLASRMCPNRFIPLYELANIYDSINQPDRALKLAIEIVNKPVKIPSATISSIKMKMKKRAEGILTNTD